MAKQRPQPQVQSTEERKVRIFASDLWRSTMEKYRNNRAVVAAMIDFIRHKREAPLAPYGSKDYPFKAGDIKGWPHAGLTFDDSIVYKIGGRDPHILTLLGIFSHDDIGTGNPVRPKLQQKAAKAFSNPGAVRPLEPIDEKSHPTPLIVELLDI